MTTSFPTGLDALTNPTSADGLNSPDHAGQHANANDAIEALEAKVGINGSAVATSLDYKITNGILPTLNVDSGTLFVDSAGNNVGINNASPAVALDVSGAINATSTIYTSDAFQCSNASSLGPVSVAGDLTVDTNVLKVDSTNNRVGVGTASPSATLDVQATTGTAMRITNTGTGNSFLVEDSASTDSTPFVIDAAGNVGIGTTSATLAKVEVIGSVRSYPASTQDAVVIAGRAGGTSSYAATITPTTLTANRTLTLPDTTGTVVTTGDTGSVTSTMIFDGTIVNGDINASAGIALSKLASGSSAQLIVGNATGVPTYTTVTGDVTISNTGVTAIGSTVVTNGMLAGSIADSKLSTISTAGKVSNSATTATDANTASAIVARDASGNFTAGTITSRPASTQDAVVIAGRAGGTSSYLATLTPTTLTASRTLTLPDNTGELLSFTSARGTNTAWTTYTTTITQSGNVTFTTGLSRYQQIGKLINWEFVLNVTSAGTVSNAIRINIPQTAQASAAYSVFGTMHIYDASANTHYCGNAFAYSTTQASLMLNAGTTYFQTIALASGDIITGHIMYEAA
jgi:hypothetical protein